MIMTIAHLWWQWLQLIFYIDDIALMEVRFRMLLVIMMMLTVTMMVFSPREIISKFIVFGFQGWMCSQANQGPSTTQVLPPGQFGLAELSGRNCWHVLLGKIFLPVHVYLTFLISLLSLRKSLTAAQTAHWRQFSDAHSNFVDAFSNFWCTSSI